MQVYIYKIIESRVLKRDLYIPVYSSVIYNSQVIEATQIPSRDEWTDRQSMVYAYNGILSSFKKERHFNTATTWRKLEDKSI